MNLFKDLVSTLFSTDLLITCYQLLIHGMHINANIAEFLSIEAKSLNYSTPFVEERNDCMLRCCKLIKSRLKIRVKGRALFFVVVVLVVAVVVAVVAALALVVVVAVVVMKLLLL